MFTGFFSLLRQPFTAEMPTEALFASAPLRQALARLRFVIDQHGIGLITGEPGSGKSVAVRALVASCEPATHEFIYLTAPRSPRGLLQLLCHALVRLDGHGLTPVLLCDEAQLAPVSVLDEIRLLTITAMDSRCPLAIVLSGHGSLRRRLALESLLPLAQRMTVATALSGLSAAQTAEYIQHQLTWAGASRPLFTREVIELIAHCSRGSPRQINRLATAALLAAYAVQHPLVEEPAFRQALKQIEPESA